MLFRYMTFYDNPHTGLGLWGKRNSSQILTIMLASLSIFCLIAVLMQPFKAVLGQGCQYPDPAINFKNEQYIGNPYHLDSYIS